MTNPYGNGTAAETIARVADDGPLEGLLIKQPAPLTTTIAKNLQSPHDDSAQRSRHYAS